MGCGSCGVATKDGVSGCGSQNGCSTGGCNRLNVFDWLSDMPIAFGQKAFDVIEVSFNNGARKGYYRNYRGLELNRGDTVTVEASQGFDIGQITLQGELVKLQLKKRKLKENSDLIRRLLHKTTEEELSTFSEARAKSQETLVKARAIAASLNLSMKVSEVEYQGDNKKATFYYIADNRIDFRELVRHYVKEFKIKVEMRQIGARQEASRIGGIGDCGRELCCSTWLTDFKSVSTSAARYQNLAINTEKLSGQCGRLKCCLNFELDTYLDALGKFPKKVDRLETEEGIAELRKTEIFKELMWYSVRESRKMYKLNIDSVIQVKEMNQAGKRPTNLADFDVLPEEIEIDKAEDLVGQVSLESLEKRNKNRNKRRKKSKRGSGRSGQQNTAGQKPKGQKPGQKKSGQNTGSQQKKSSPKKEHGKGPQSKRNDQRRTNNKKSGSNQNKGKKPE